MEDLIDFAKSNFQYENKWLEYQWAEASEVSGLRYKCILPQLTTQHQASEYIGLCLH